MAMTYPHTEIADAEIPRATLPLTQHLLDTYASETNKVAAIWHAFTDADLTFRPQERASAVADILKHQVLSERRFFAEFLGAPDPPPPGPAPRHALDRRGDHAVRASRPRSPADTRHRHGILVARTRPVLRRSARTHLGLLAPRAPH